MTTSAEKWIETQVEEYEKLALLTEEELEAHFAAEAVLNEDGYSAGFAKTVVAFMEQETQSTFTGETEEEFLAWLAE